MSTQSAVKPSLSLKRRLNAPPERVFAAWTDPKKIAGWFGPQQVVSVHAEIDLRVGGRYRLVAQMPGDQFEVGGVYREIVANQKLVFTWAWKSTPERESLVTVTIRPDGDGTMLTITHEQFFDEEARDRHQAGWNGALDKLEKFVAA